MSKISNTTAYPTVTPAAGDLLVITDVSDSNATKTATVSSISSAISDAGLQTQEITLTSAQLLSLNGGGTIELIEAPGSDKAILPFSIVGFLDFNTTVYNFSNSIALNVGTQAYTSIFIDAINSSADNYFNTKAQEQLYTGLAATLSVNSPLNLIYGSSATVTTGDSPLTLSVLYRIVDFS